VNSETKKLARKIWDYHHLNHQLSKADCIFVMGSHDTRVAERGAELFLKGYAPWLLMSGGLGNLTKDMWDEPEADKFAKIAIKMGVPKEKILIENKSTNTGENIQFSYDLLKSKKLLPKKMILVQKPYMERRTYATFKKQWPGEDVEIFVTSPQISFGEYPNKEISLDRVVSIMVGDLQRIKEYPAQGFQIHQDIPDDVWRAYEKLVAQGFTEHLIKENHGTKK
jgi:uncharacterized SAM-binding protein YcdF (DUF218 family)